MFMLKIGTVALLVADGNCAIYNLHRCASDGVRVDTLAVLVNGSGGAPVAVLHRPDKFEL